MKPLLVIVLVLCAVAAAIGAVVRPGIPEIAVVVCVALLAYQGLRTLRRNEKRVRTSRLDDIAIVGGSSNIVPRERSNQNPYASPQFPE